VIADCWPHSWASDHANRWIHRTDCLNTANSSYQTGLYRSSQISLNYSQTCPHLIYSFYKCWRFVYSNQVIKDMQEKYASVSSMNINLWELLKPSPCNKSILESTWVTKGPFKDLNWNIILFKQTSKQTENWKMYAPYSSQNGKNKCTYKH